MSVVSGGGTHRVASPIICWKITQFALWMLRRFTCLNAKGVARHGEEINDGRCCGRGNFSNTCRVGMPESPACANARSGLVS